jgi:phosphoribosylformylglycinamidine synthase
LNPYEGAKIAIAECARNLACSGAEPIGVTDCLNFGNPQRPEVMWQLVLAIEGLKDACEALRVPIVSGNVSLYNETNDLSIYPTPMIGMVGLIDKADSTATQWFKQAGDVIILLGRTREDLGGTEYLKIVHHREQGSPPLLNLEDEQAVQACTIRLIREGVVQSAHDCSDGGLAVALAECCVSGADGPIGAVVQLTLGGLRRDALLFGESQSRILLSVKQEQVEKVLNVAMNAGVPASRIGTVGGSRLVIRVAGDQRAAGCTIDLDVATVYEHWALAIPRTLGQD